jgi:regulator of sigma E protease
MPSPKFSLSPLSTAFPSYSGGGAGQSHTLRMAASVIISRIPTISFMSFLLETLKVIGITFCVLLIFNFIILVHEWGHFLAARWRGLKIEKFQIWMGKPIWKRTWNGVQYGLGTIPIGGFVQLPQMAPMGAIEGKTSGEELPPIKPLDKIIVAFAGPLFSLLLAFAFACAVWKTGELQKDSPVVGYAQPGKPAEAAGMKPGDTILAVNGKEVTSFSGLTRGVRWEIASGHTEEVNFTIRREGESAPRDITVHAPYKEGESYQKWQNETSWLQKLYMRPPLRQVGIAPMMELRVKKTLDHSPAALAGVKEGDIFLTANGEKLYNPMWLSELAEKYPDKPIETTVLRDGQTISLTMQPRMPEVDPRPEKDRTAEVGMWFESVHTDNPPLAYPSPFTLVADCFRNTFATLQALLTPKSPIGPSQMSGPVGILNVYYQIFQNPQWWRLVLWFSVVLNVGLAIFNMLPLPVLDGGHIVMATMEAVRGKPMNTRLLEFVQIVCVLGLLSFVLFVTLKDVGQIASGGGEIEFKPLPAAPAAAPAVTPG